MSKKKYRNILSRKTPGKKEKKPGSIYRVRRTTITKVKKSDILFIAVDPGLAFPGFTIMKEDYSHVLSVNIDGSKIVGTVYQRAYMVGIKIIEFLKLEELEKHELCLIIEGSSFTKNSKSLEQLAAVRQAVFDAFSSHMSNGFSYFISLSPTEIKKEVTGYAFASKIQVFTWSNAGYPSVFSNMKLYRIPKKGKNKGVKELLKVPENLSDSIAIAYTGVKKWNLNPQMYQIK